MLTWAARVGGRRRVAVALLAILVGACGASPGSVASPSRSPSTPAAPTGGPSATSAPAAMGLGPHSWQLAVWSEADQAHVSITYDVESDTVLLFEVGENAVSVRPGRAATITRTEDGRQTILRLRDAATGAESERLVFDGFIACAEIADSDVIFSVHEPGRDGGVWSVSDGEAPQPIVPAGDLPLDADHTLAGRFVMWSSPSGQTIAADLVLESDRTALDLIATGQRVRRVEMPAGANVVGITDEIAIVMNQDFVGAVNLRHGASLWRLATSPGGVGQFYVTSDNQSLIVTLVPKGQRSLELQRIHLSSGEVSVITSWPDDAPFPHLWTQVSTDEVAVVGRDGDLGDALSVGNWTAIGSAVGLTDGQPAGEVAITVKPMPVP